MTRIIKDLHGVPPLRDGKIRRGCAEFAAQRIFNGNAAQRQYRGNWLEEECASLAKRKIASAQSQKCDRAEKSIWRFLSFSCYSCRSFQRPQPWRTTNARNRG